LAGSSRMLSGSFFKSKRRLLRPSRSGTTDDDQTWIQLDEQTAGGEMLSLTFARKGDPGQGRSWRGAALCDAVLSGSRRLPGTTQRVPRPSGHAENAGSQEKNAIIEENSQIVG